MQSVYIPTTTGSDTTVPFPSTSTWTPIKLESSPQAALEHSTSPGDEYLTGFMPRAA